MWIRSRDVQRVSMYQQSLLALPEVERVSRDYVILAKSQISIRVNFEVYRCCGLNFFVIRCALFLVVDYYCRPLSAMSSELLGFHRRPHVDGDRPIYQLISFVIACHKGCICDFKHLDLSFGCQIFFIHQVCQKHILPHFVFIFFKVARKRNPFTQCNGVCC